MPALRLLRAVLLVAVAGCGGGGAAASPAPRETPVVVSPSTGGKHQRFAVAVTTRRATGVFGKTRRNYTAEARAVHPASGCVNNPDRRFPDGAVGRRVHGTLDPARGEGGRLGWCRGLFRGTVTYFEGFACPPVGTCSPPHGFPERSRVIARFSFRVR